MLTAQLRQLLAPPIFPADEEKSRIAGLLHLILVTLALVFAVNTLGTALMGGAGMAVWLSLATVMVTGILIVVLRRGHVQAASLATVGAFWLLITAAMVWVAGLTLGIVTSYFVLVLLAGLLAGQWPATAFMLLSLLAGGGVAVLQAGGRLAPIAPGSYLVNALAAAGNLVALTMVLNLTIRALNRAVGNLRRSNQALEETQASLAARVAERTRDLALAAEVGRSVSQVHDVPQLLQQAVDLIRERFDLYYTQVYLLSGNGRRLVLAAGTGPVGAELLGRAHALPVGPGSINGLAAEQRQAVIVADTAGSPIFRANPLLPDTRSEMSVPLLAGEQLVGVLNLQSRHAHGLSPDNLPVFETMASQLAVSIENTRLFAEANRARADAEAILARLTRAGWERHFNAIDRPVYLGYTSDAQSTQPLTTPLQALEREKDALQVPIRIAGETIGAIQVEAEDERLWANEAISLVTAVAQQVAQQVEHLRLLAEADRYRQEAESALQRVTREGWQQAEAEIDVAGFTFDQVRIRPLAEAGESRLAPPPGLRQPLSIRGETIATLEVSGVEAADAETKGLVAAVSAQLSAHLENLRLGSTTEHALAQTRQRSEELAVVNQIAQTVAAELDPSQLLAGVRRQLKRIMPLDTFSVSLVDADAAALRPLYVYDTVNGTRTDLPPVPLAPHLLGYHTVNTGEPRLIHFTAEEVAAHREQPPAYLIDEDASITASLIFVPLRRGTEVIGVLSVQCYELNAYTDSDASLLAGVASYVSTAMQNARLFAQTQQALSETATLYQIGIQLNGAQSFEEIVAAVVAALSTNEGPPVVGTLYLCDIDSDGQPAWLRAVASNEPAPEADSGMRRAVSKFPAASLWLAEPDAPILIADTATDSRLDETMQYLYEAADIQSMVIMPLRLGQRWLGVCTLHWPESRVHFTEADSRLYRAIASQLTTVVNSQMLFAETRARAEREALINTINQKIQRAPTVQSALQTAVAELGRALRARRTVVELEVAPEQNGRTTPATTAELPHG